MAWDPELLDTPEQRTDYDWVIRVGEHEFPIALLEQRSDGRPPIRQPIPGQFDLSRGLEQKNRVPPQTYPAFWTAVYSTLSLEINTALPEGFRDWQNVQLGFKKGDGGVEYLDRNANTLALEFALICRIMSDARERKVPIPTTYTELKREYRRMYTHEQLR
jgi:hypothetical protein